MVCTFYAVRRERAHDWQRHLEHRALDDRLVPDRTRFLFARHRADAPSTATSLVIPLPRWSRASRDNCRRPGGHLHRGGSCGHPRKAVISHAARRPPSRLRTNCSPTPSSAQKRSDTPAVYRLTASLFVTLGCAFDGHECHLKSAHGRTVVCLARRKGPPDDEHARKSGPAGEETGYVPCRSQGRSPFIKTREVRCESVSRDRSANGYASS
jgi:hypothetical protein